MKTWNKLIHDDLNTVAEGLDEFFRVDHFDRMNEARTAQRYYESDHDIKRSRILYYNDHGHLVEDEASANVKIPHSFFTEQVDQKVQYLLSNDVEFETDDQKLQELLANYIDDDFQLFLDEMVEGASIKGKEYAYIRTLPDGSIKFQVSNSLNTRNVYDDDQDVVAVVRFYSRYIEAKEITYAEVYTDEWVKYFVRKTGKKFQPDPSYSINPQQHIMGYDSGGEVVGKNYDRIPFHELLNNKEGDSDLRPIKELIDDYDRMSSFLSNNLEDYDKPIFVVSGYRGESLDEVKAKIKSKGIIRDGGAPNTKSNGLDIKTYQIPYEARKEKMAMDKEAIYKFGMAFDSSQTGDGNITNVVIKSRYSLLDLKCNKIEPRLRNLIQWCLELILKDLELKGHGTYDINDINVIITRNMMFNEVDQKDIELKEAQRKLTLMNSLAVAAPHLPDHAILEQICEVYDLNPDELELEY